MFTQIILACLYFHQLVSAETALRSVQQLNNNQVCVYTAITGGTRHCVEAGKFQNYNKDGLKSQFNGKIKRIEFPAGNPNGLFVYLYELDNFVGTKTKITGTKNFSGIELETSCIAVISPAPANEICLYKADHFRGERRCYSSGNHGMPSGWDDKMRSVQFGSNAKNNKILRLFQDAGHKNEKDQLKNSKTTLLWDQIETSSFKIVDSPQKAVNAITDKICLYTGKFYAGTSDCWPAGKMIDLTRDNNLKNKYDDKVRSIYVPSGLRLVYFEDPKWQNQLGDVTTSNDDMNFNQKKLSSFVVFRA